MTKQERATMDSAAVKKTKMMEENRKLEAIQFMYDIHSKEIRNNYDRGIVNGIALAISILTGEPSKYIGDDSC